MASAPGTALFRDLLTRLAHTDAAPKVTRLSVVADHDGIHTAKAVAQGLARHPRFVWRWWPTYCPRAHPLARACGDVHAKCTRHHQRKRLRALGQDVEQPRH